MPSALLDALGPEGVFTSDRGPASPRQRGRLSRPGTTSHGRLEAAPDAVVLAERRGPPDFASSRSAPPRASRSCPSAEEPVWSAAWSPCAATQPLVSLDLAGLRDVDVDTVSLTATPGRWAARPRGRGGARAPMGHWYSATSRSPLSTRRSVASPQPARPGQASSGYGRFDALVSSVACFAPPGAAHAADPPHGGWACAERARDRLRGRLRRDPRRQRQGATSAPSPPL